MTDKQIIIDGVDVSGCGFYHSETGTECHIALAFAEEYTDDTHTYFKCEQNPNCNYKQFKRSEAQCEAMFVSHTDLEKKYKAKEQECEQLSNAYEACKDSRLKAYNTIDMLEQECEKIKEDNATLFDKAIEARKECTDLKEQLFLLKINYAELEKRHNDGFEQFNQLKADNKELKKCYKNNSALLDFEETNTTKLVNKVMKLEKTLTEIKELLLKTPTDSQEHCVNVKSVILQKISECEVENDNN